MIKQPQSAPAHSAIGNKIHLLRDLRVMIDSDLAELYGTQTKVLVQAVKRNLVRFPSDFMFQLTSDEFSMLSLNKALPSA
jgi:ORF6N domain